MIRSGDQYRCLVRRALAQLALSITRWRIVGKPPDHSAVIIGAFHTCNWDFPKLVAVKWIWGFHPYWIGKHTLFRGPFDRLFRRMGGIPVNRSQPGNFVDEMADLFDAQEPVLLVITPEGTRSASQRWKSGFYRIATHAQVPLALGFVDYRTRTFGIGPTVELTGDVAVDMDAIRAFYADKLGRHPENHGLPLLTEETV